MVISRSDIDNDSLDCGSWEKLCDMAGLPKTDENHPWNERAFARLEITGIRLLKGAEDSL